MSFWNSAIGGMIGFSIGGPIGGLIGAVIGSKMGGSKRVKYNVSSNQEVQAAFFTALFACLAKLAKSDGTVSKEEIIKVDEFMKERFKFSKDQRQFAIGIFNTAKDDSVSYEEYANQLNSILTNNPNSLMMFYELLFELAYSDNMLHPNEERLLKITPAIFGFHDSLFDEIKSKFTSNLVDPYKVLGVNKEMQFEEIKKVYRKKRNQFHPDKLISKGLPEELLEKAEQKFIEIQEAFEEIEKRTRNS